MGEMGQPFYRHYLAEPLAPDRHSSIIGLELRRSAMPGRMNIRGE
jgi:hypothetical protein